MVYKIDYSELASSINPIAFAKYLRDTGWVQFDTKLPEKISLSHNYYQPIHSSVTRMKGNIKKNRKIVGRIKRLEATADLENRQAGKVSVVYVDDNNKAKTVIARLTKEDYDRAIEAHTKGWYVEVIGEMSGGRSSEIECSSFNIL